VNKRKSTKKVVKKYRQSDDIPGRALHTYHTQSCAIPVASDSCVVRAIGQSVLIASNSANVTLQQNFSLSQSGVGAGQWDQYKILAVRYTIAPDNNAIGLVTNSTTTLPTLINVLDFDDSSALSSFVAAEGYSNAVLLAPGESCERVFKPRMAISAYSSSFGAFANVADLWIDCVSNTVQHYGVKIFVPQTTAAQTLLPSWKCTSEYWIAFRKSI
jgi:hypothetical protein